MAAEIFLSYSSNSKYTPRHSAITSRIQVGDQVVSDRIVGLNQMEFIVIMTPHLKMGLIVLMSWKYIVRV